MAGALTTAWRDSTPESLDADLAEMWREAGRDGPVSRALMSNLVVVSPHRAFPNAGEVARKHPARTILLSYSTSAGEAAAPEGVRIGLLTFGEGTARYGLEMIAVHAACADRSLPSIVSRLTIGNVPTSVWWTADMSAPEPSITIATLGRQLIYNSALWHDVKAGVGAAASLFAHHAPPDLVDLNWRRVAPIRRGLVHALRRETQADVRISSARITHAPGEAAAAWLLAGWLASRLKDAGVIPAVQIADAAQPLSIALDGKGWWVTATMSEHAVEVKSERPALTLAVPQESEAEAVASELLTLAPDRALRDALRTLTEPPLAGLL